MSIRNGMYHNYHTNHIIYALYLASSTNIRNKNTKAMLAMFYIIIGKNEKKKRRLYISTI